MTPYRTRTTNTAAPMNYEPGGMWAVQIAYGDGTGMRTHRSTLERALQLVAEEHVQKAVKEVTVSYITILDTLIKS